MDILYHYCSNASFVSIIENRTINLSSLKLSNDSMEGKVLADVFTRICLSDGYSLEEIGEALDIFKIHEDIFDGLGFCLSKEGDLLSQWRGYAADATGVSIGFSKTYLDCLIKEKKEGYFITEVQYDDSKQEEVIRPAYNEFKAHLSLKKPSYPSLLSEETDDDYNLKIAKFKNDYKQMVLSSFILLYHIFALKNKAFAEEKEWRILTYYLKEFGGDLQYNASNNKIIPYKPLKIVNLENEPILKVFIGPKNVTPLRVVEGLLKKNGFHNVEIVESSASYR